MKPVSILHRMLFFCFLTCIVIACKPSGKSTKTLTVFVAASVTEVMNEIAKEFENRYGVKLRLNFASSGILARQIENGAEFDYYISANKEWITYLDSMKLIEKQSMKKIAGNTMVAIVPLKSTLAKIDEESICNFPNLFTGRLCMGDPSHVPAGKYAKQIIRTHSWEKDFKERVLPAKNVRDVLFMVEIGEVEMGLVYFSDAQKSKKVNIVYEFPIEDCDSIQYFSAVNKVSDESVKLFGKFLNEKKAKSIWRENGFKMQLTE